MLVNMSPESQKQHENMDAHIIIIHLKDLFDMSSKIESYETFKELFCFMMITNSSINTYILKIIDCIEKLR